VRQPSPTFEVESFEYVEAGPGLALLRLAGSWGAGDPPDDVALVAWSDGERVPLSPLPAPPAGGGAWRAAYSASPDLLRDTGTAFELEPPAGRSIPLPAPVEHGAVQAAAEEPPAPALPPALEPPADPPPPQRPPARLFGRRRAAPPAPRQPESHAALSEALAAEQEARRAAELTAAEERARAQHADAVVAEELRSTVGKTQELIARIDGYEHKRVTFEVELDAVRRTHADLLAEAREGYALELQALREQLDAAQSELAAALEELAARDEHLDTLHKAHSLELGAARRQRDAAEERQGTLEQQLADERAGADALRARLEDRESLIERARAEAAQATQESADLHAAVARLRDAIAARARDAAASKRRFVRDPDALARAREELRRDAERIAALERQAETLRDAIHSQLPYSLHASPLQEALPISEAEADESDLHPPEVGAPPSG
jgi:hypothetical protein